MIPKRSPSGFDPMGRIWFSEKIMRKQMAGAHDDSTKGHPALRRNQSGAVRTLSSGSGEAAACGVLAAASGLLLLASGSFASGFCVDGPVDLAGTGTVAQTGPSGTSLQARGR